MRILMANLGYPPNVVGGAELMVQSLGRELARQGTQVSVASLSHTGRDWQADDSGVRSYFVHAHPMGIALMNPRRTRWQKLVWHAWGEMNPWIARKLMPILITEEPDIIHTHSLLGLSIGVWRLAQALHIPVVHTLHDYQLLCPRGTMFRRGQLCIRPCASCRLLTMRRKAATEVPAAVVGISQSILRTHIANGYFPRARPMAVPNGVAEPPRSGSHGIRAPLIGPLKIGFMGRLHPTKGLELLLDALRGLPLARYTLRIAGSGSPAYEQHLRQYAKGLAVDFLGWVDREQFYNQINVLVVPSIYAEPQGMVLVEAANFGVPVIYSIRGGLAETGAAFENFIGFDPTEQGALRRTLLSLIEHRKPIIAPNTARPRMPEAFTLKACVASYLRLYDETQKRAGDG